MFIGFFHVSARTDFCPAFRFCIPACKAKTGFCRSWECPVGFCVSNSYGSAACSPATVKVYTVVIRLPVCIKGICFGEVSNFCTRSAGSIPTVKNITGLYRSRKCRVACPDRNTDIAVGNGSAVCLECDGKGFLFPECIQNMVLWCFNFAGRCDFVTVLLSGKPAGKGKTSTFRGRECPI